MIFLVRNVASQASRSGASSQHNGAQDKKKLRKGKKDLKLLSFGEEAELEQGEEEDLAGALSVCGLPLEGNRRNVMNIWLRLWLRCSNSVVGLTCHESFLMSLSIVTQRLRK